MSRLPFVNYNNRSQQKQISVMGGYDCRLVAGENTFHDMQNMSSDFYPAISTRAARGPVIKQLTKPNGLFWKNGLAYVDGTDFYYKDEVVGTVEDSAKQMIGMGAYILIWPDKKYYNTSEVKADKEDSEDKKDRYGDLEKVFVQTAAATIAPVSEGATFVKITSAGLDFKQWDGVTIEGCTNESLNKTTVVQSVDKDCIVVTGVIDKSFTQDSGLKISTKVPDMDFVAESDNRIWGCSSAKHEIYTCKLGDPFNWSCYEGISTDSYTATVGSDGDFTGIVSHMGYVLFFKESTIHKMYGNKPSNFQLNSYSLPGVAAGCSKSIRIVNETLFYKSRNGVCTYDGSVPYVISEQLGTTAYVEAVSGQASGKYYVSLKDSSGMWSLFAYDPAAQMWCKEDTTHMQHTAYGDGQLYYIDGNNRLMTIRGSEEEQIEWYLESGELEENSLEKKYLSKLLFNMQLDRGAKVDVYISCDSDPLWRRKATVNATQHKTYAVPLIPARCSHFKYRLEGRGGFKLIGIGKYVEEGSEM